MECLKSILVFVSEVLCAWWHFQKKLEAILPKLKVQLGNLPQTQWSAGFEILLWAKPQEAEGTKSEVRRSVKAVFIRSWDDSGDHCWFLFTLCWPFPLQSSLFSCDPQLTAHVAGHLWGMVLANWYIQSRGSRYLEMPIRLQLHELCFLPWWFSTEINIHVLVAHT